MYEFRRFFVMVNVCRYFLQSTFNPDLLYVVLFLHTQLTTTVTLAFLFGSKVGTAVYSLISD